MFSLIFYSYLAIFVAFWPLGPPGLLVLAPGPPALAPALALLLRSYWGRRLLLGRWGGSGSGSEDNIVRLFASSDSAYFAAVYSQ